MADINALVGPPLQVSEQQTASATRQNDVAVVDGDIDTGTSWAIAFIVLGALAFLILFKYAGFQTVIAARVSVGD